MSCMGVAATPARRLSPLLLRRGRLSRRHAGDTTNTTRSMSAAASAGGSRSGGGSDGAPARSYETALELLAALQSNRAVTSLFTSPPPPPPPSPPDVTAPATATTTVAAAAAATPRKTDLNAQAIPEMRQWLGRAGLSPACDDLAAAGVLCVHVAGTKGKGSVCAYLTSILTQPELSLVTTTADGVGGSKATAAAAGREKTKKQAVVGTYTSPHLVSVRERIQVGGRPLPPERFARYFYEVWDAMSASARAELEAKDDDSGDAKRQGQQLTAAEREAREAEICGPASKPFYFRFLTVLALHAFLREGVTAAVVECGIGGEHDSTNVLPASCVSASVVAQLGVDHVGMLGGTLPEIAWHKAGVCKAGRKCFTLRLGDDDGQGKKVAGEAGATMAVLRRRAAEKGAQLCEIDDDQIDGLIGRDRDGPGQQEVEVLGRESGFGDGCNNPSLQGDFQRSNQALAAAAAREHLRVAAGLGEPLPEWEPAIRRGLREARLRGRCETRPDDDAHGPGLTWHIDGAHTAESLAGVARWFAQQQPPEQKQQLQHLQRQQDGKTLSAQRETAPVRRVLVFNQQERDASRLLGGMLKAAAVCRGDGPAEQGKGAREGLFFDTAIFTRNEEMGASAAGDGDERDLSVQRAGEQVMRELSPGTATYVVDNVSSAVREARAQAAGAGAARTLVLVTGSLHLVGALLRTLEPDAPP